MLFRLQVLRRASPEAAQVGQPVDQEALVDQPEASVDRAMGVSKDLVVRRRVVRH